MKAFRCGEFDACIERAEASQGVLLKKREKYARREDAILHALELEKQKHRYSAGLELSGHSSSGLDLMDDDQVGNSKSAISTPQTHSWRVDLLPEEGSGGGGGVLSTALKHRNVNQMKWEAESSGSIPSTRGLQGLGLCVAAAKKMVSEPIACEGSKPAVFSNTTYFGGYSWFCPSSGSSSAYLGSAPWLADRVLASAFPGQGEKEHAGTVRHAKSSNCMPLRADISDCVDRTEYSFDQAQISPAQVGYDGETLQSSPLPGEETSSGLVKDDDETSSSVKTFLGDDGTLPQGWMRSASASFNLLSLSL